MSVDSWGRIEFDFTPFGSNLSSLTRLELRFTNATVATATPVFVDDIWLLYNKTADDTASISQTFAKSWASSGQPGSIILSWDTMPVRIDNVSLAHFEVAVASSSRSIQSWGTNFTAAGPWATRSMDLSLLLAPADTYTITFSLRVVIGTFAATNATVRIDNVLILAPDYSSGTYTSIPLDAGSPVVWGQATWTATIGPQTRVLLDTRSGSTAVAGDPTWSGWLPHAASGMAIGSPNDRYIQFSISLLTFNSSLTPVLYDLTLTFSRFPALGSVESQQAFFPPDTLIAWRTFGAVDVAPNETLVTYEVSDRNGTFWTSVSPGENLDSFHDAAIRVRAWLTTSNSSVTPRVVSMSVMYEFRGRLWSAALTPPAWNGTADETPRFTAEGFDAWGHPVAFTPAWETTDPSGSISPDGVYHPRTAGSYVVRVLAPSGVVLANASVNVTAGNLTRLVVTPSATTASAGAVVRLDAEGFDAHDNGVTLAGTVWTATDGTFLNETAASADLLLPPLPGTVNVTARVGTVAGTAQVQVTALDSPEIHGQVPAQVHPEDSSWGLNLTAYAANQPNPANDLENLSWVLTGQDSTLYNVFGEGWPGNHVLTFATVPDAYGTDQATLWLRNRTGAATSQPLTITITPVDDPPYFTTVPNLAVKAGEPYTFDASPYIVDVDTPPADLVLTTGDQEHVSVAGLNLTITYGSDDLGRTVFLPVSVSDGTYTAQTVIIIKVTTDAPPIVVHPPPDVTLAEDEVLTRAFPLSLTEYFSDPDGDPLFFSYGYRDINVTIWNNAGFWQVDIRPNPDWNGVERVTFRATDANLAFAEYTISVTVTPVNDPPTFTWHNDVSVRFDTPYVLQLRPYIDDIDNPLSQVTLQASPSRFAQVDRFDVTLLFPRSLLGPAPTYSVPVTFYVNDTAPGPVQRILVHVTGNAPPALLRALPDVMFEEDTSYTAYRLSSYFYDPDHPGANLRYASVGENVSADIDPNSTVTFRAAANWNGHETVLFRAEDAEGAFLIAPVEVRVVPVDDPPRFARSIADIDLTGGGVRVIDLRQYVEDPDNNVSTLNYTAEGAHAAVYGYMLVLDYPASAVSGPVRVTVSDGVYTASTSFQVTLAPPEPPTIWAQIYWPWSGLGIVLAAAAVLALWTLVLRFPRILEDVFIIGRDGRLVLHNTRRLRADRDEDILAGMLTAIMLFVKDSFREEHEDLKEFEFGDRQVLVERGEHCYIAAIYGGEAPPWARKDLAAFVRDVESNLGDRLENWSGDSDDLKGLKGMTEEFVQRRRYGGGKPAPAPPQGP